MCVCILFLLMSWWLWFTFNLSNWQMYTETLYLKNAFVGQAIFNMSNSSKLLKKYLKRLSEMNKFETGNVMSLVILFSSHLIGNTLYSFLFFMCHLVFSNLWKLISTDLFVGIYYLRIYLFICLFFFGLF